MACCCDKNKESTSCCSSVKKESIFSQGLLLIISAVAIATSFFLGYFHIEMPLHPFTDPAWIAVFLSGYPIMKAGIKNLLKGKITSSFLVTIAIFGAIFLQFFEAADTALHICSNDYIFAAGEIAFLMSIGEWIEDKTVKKSKAGIESLSKLIPEVATLKSGEVVNISTLKIGDILKVLPNTLFPMDGEILSGDSLADESSITGESLPVEKPLGSKVYAGTMNLSGYVEIRVESLAKDSQVAKIAKLVESASGKNAPISRYADKWASKVIPMAISFAILTYFGTMHFLDLSSLEAAIRAVTILVVFCPCAFVLATPTAIAAALGNAARKGLLIKSGEAVEKLSEVKSVFFDKTGTITQAKIKVDSIIFFDDFKEDYILELAAISEKLSDHPVGKAIYNHIGKDVPDPQDLQSSISKGIVAKCKGVTVKMQALSDSKFAKAGLSCVEMTIDDKLAAIFYLSDVIRDTSKSCVESLHKLGINCTMLSGDNKIVVEKVAKAVSISSFRGELLPSDKLDIIKNAQKQNKVCMVGDGVNDAPALAQADTSIAIASLKNSVAIEAAESSIVGDNLNLVAFAIRLSKRAMKTIKFNLSFSVTWNFIVLILAFFGMINPVSGALLHNISSIFVVLNSAMILKFENK